MFTSHFASIINFTLWDKGKHCCEDDLLQHVLDGIFIHRSDSGKTLKGNQRLMLDVDGCEVILKWYLRYHHPSQACNADCFVCMSDRPQRRNLTGLRKQALFVPARLSSSVPISPDRIDVCSASTVQLRWTGTSILTCHHIVGVQQKGVWTVSLCADSVKAFLPLPTFLHVKAGKEQV